MRVARLFLFADWPEKNFSGQSEGGISNASGTHSVRVSTQGLSRSCYKLSPMKIPSSRLAAPGSPRMPRSQCLSSSRPPRALVWREGERHWERGCIMKCLYIGIRHITLLLIANSNQNRRRSGCLSIVHKSSREPARSLK